MDLDHQPEEDSLHILGSATPPSGCYIHFNKTVMPRFSILNGLRVWKAWTSSIGSRKQAAKGHRTAAPIIALALSEAQGQTNIKIRVWP